VVGDHGVPATVAQATNSHLDEIAKQAVADTSTGRFTHPQEVADLVVLLASVIGPATSPTPTSSSTES
jgi:NAD(P)-dependent dehydrogenase (short-subunit alcohol dehydrogenase family)